MAIDRVKVTVRRLIALEKYENVTYECAVEGNVPEGQTPEQVYQEQLEFCKGQVAKELTRLKG